MNSKVCCIAFTIAAIAFGLLLVSGQDESPAAPSTQGAIAPPAGGRGGRAGPIVSPEIGADRRVTFRLRAPTAHDVAVIGIDTPRPMTKDSQGVWTVTTEALAPEIYIYRFSVDGGFFADPANPQSAQSSAAGGSSILSIPGVTWTYADVPHGAVAKHVYNSSVIGGPESFYVYTPPDYNAHRRRAYPVLYLLHGLGDEAYGWIANGGAPATLDNLIAQAKAKPMIMVSPTGYGNLGGTKGAAAGFPNFTQALIEEIMPMVQKQYNAASSRNENAIAGLSMGGAQSLLLLNHLDQFAWIGSFSPGFDMYAPTWGQPVPGNSGRGNPNLAPLQPGGSPTVRMRPLLSDGNLAQRFPSLDPKANVRIKLLYVVCGTADDHLQLTRQFKSFLDRRGIKVDYVEVPGAAHVWPLWRDQLAQFAQMIFKS